jgi:hypothetical protein
MITLSVALLAAGCGAGPGTPQEAPVPSPSAAAPASVPGPSAAVTPTRTTPPPLTAANGTRLRSCADGTCEVIVKDGDRLPNTGGAGPVEVSVSAGSVTISTTGDGGFTSTLGGPAGTVQRINDQRFLIVEVRGRRAVLRLSTE